MRLDQTICKIDPIQNGENSLNKSLFLLTTLILFGCQTTVPSEPKIQHPPYSAKVNSDPSHEAQGHKYAIATQGIASSKAAREILDHGGNLVDAAIAASFVTSVERPQSTGLGGGGFFLFHEAQSGKNYAIDFRERAPHLATENMYLDSKGQVNTDLSRDGIKAVGVPGLVAGLVEIHHRFGHLPFSQVVAPAIQLAEKGFPVYPHLADALKLRAVTLAKDPAARKIFLDHDRKPWPLGHVLLQKDLAQTLRLIVKKGKNAFYRGSIGEKLVAFSKKSKGLISKQDLLDYEVKWRKPVIGHFHDYEIVSMPPPSSGGTHVIQFLQILEKDPLRQMGVLSAEALHLEAAALQMAFADRAQYLGDPDFTQIPLKGLLSPSYAQFRRSEIPRNHARPSSEVRAGPAPKYESDQTTHMSFIDLEGNAISTTQTNNGYMGAGIVVPGTGIVLNNEMDDFSAQVGAANMFGAIGGKSNSIAPQKTPLSSMSPTFLIRKGKVEMALGAPGGTRIISCVAQTILNYTEFKLPLYDSIASVRYHYQWYPDILDIESPGVPLETQNQLKKWGYEVQVKPIPCHVMAVTQEEGLLHAVADPRDIGTSVAE